MARGRHVSIRGIPWTLPPEGTAGVRPGFALYTAQRVSRVAHANLRRRPIPTPLAAGMYYRRDPAACDLPVTWWTARENGAADCKTLTGWELARLYLARGRWPEGLIEDSGLAGTLHVRLAESDPSLDLARRGRSKDGRRPRAPECELYQPYQAGMDGLRVPMHEAGALAEHQREDLLDPQLQAGIEAARQAGIPVYLVSGRRDEDRQIGLFEARMQSDRKAGREAPESWAEVEAEWSRWWPWVLATSKGRAGNGPFLALPGLSRHQRGEAADLGIRGARGTAERDEGLARVAEVAREYMVRPMVSEPWHYEPRGTP